MTQITVSAELARQIAGAAPPIVFVDESGRPIGQITQVASNSVDATPLSPEDWAQIKQRTRSPGSYSTLREIKERHGWQDQE